MSDIEVMVRFRSGSVVTDEITFYGDGQTVEWVNLFPSGVPASRSTFSFASFRETLSALKGGSTP